MKDSGSDIGMSLNDFNSDSQSKKGLNMSNKTKLILAISAFLIVIIAIVIIIIVIISIEKKKENKEKNELVTAEIIGNYEIKSISKPTDILGIEYELDPQLEIYVNGQKIKNSKSYEFNTIGQNKIQYIFYQNKINLNYMFKDINSLISIELKSNKNTTISS